MTNQVYGLADTLHWFHDFDGILGLAPSKTYFSPRNVTLVANIMPYLQSQVLGVNIVHDGVSTFSFGTTDPQHRNNVWAPITSESSWDVRPSSFGVHPDSDRTDAVCLVDTGGAGILVPLSVANSYWRTVEGATSSDGGIDWSFPCSASSSIPALNVTVDGNTLSVPGMYNFFNLGGGFCMAKARGQGNDCSLGQPLMQAYYTTFDYSNKRIGFSPKSSTSEDTMSFLPTPNPIKVGRSDKRCSADAIHRLNKPATNETEDANPYELLGLCIHIQLGTVYEDGLIISK